MTAKGEAGVTSGSPVGTRWGGQLQENEMERRASMCGNIRREEFKNWERI